MKEAILIIIGALISCGTTFFLDWIKCKREEKIYYKRKKEEIYEKCCALLSKVMMLINNNPIPHDKDYFSDIIDELILLTVQMEIFVPKHICKEFSELVKEFNENKKISKEKEENFIKILRENLKIEE